MGELFLSLFDLALQDGDSRRNLVNQVMHACQTYGMFQLHNHGISSTVLENAMTSAREFFDVSEVSEGISNPKCMHYTSSYAHALGIAQPPLYWTDVLQLDLNSTGVVADGWPTVPDAFRTNVWDLATSMELVERRLLSLICEGLGLDETYFDTGLCGAPHIVANNYPPCSRPTQTLGMPEHCDAGVLTISLLGDVPGTQIYVNGELLAVPQSSNGLLVTVGHQLQVISDGAFKAPLHREVVNSERTRTTISHVSEPRGDYVVGPATELTRTNPPRYKSFRFEEYVDHYYRDYHNTSSILERYYMSS